MAVMVTFVGAVMMPWKHPHVFLVALVWAFVISCVLALTAFSPRSGLMAPCVLFVAWRISRMKE